MKIGLYLLADGMGGARAGEMASRLAVDTVAQVVKESWQRDPQVLLSAVEEANRRVLEASIIGVILIAAAVAGFVEVEVRASGTVTV